MKKQPKESAGVKKEKPAIQKNQEKEAEKRVTKNAHGPLQRFKEKYYANMRLAGIEIPPEKYLKIIVIQLAFAAVFIDIFYGVYSFVTGPSIIKPLIALPIIFLLLQLFFFLRISLKSSSRIKKMEIIFPDVVQLMASNLRAGMTIDRAFILSARPEFYPLDGEIIRAGKDIATGKEITIAFRTMSARIGSEKISKTISLIISGLRSGGNISLLLEQTASNMREKEFIEKRISSNVLMYVIFIFFAVSIGAPLLFGLSSILVEILIKIVGSLPSDSLTANLPFTLSKVGIDAGFIKWFAILFIFTTDILASFILGLVAKGDEKAGFKFMIPLLMISYGLFFLVRIVLRKFLLDNLSLNV